MTLKSPFRGVVILSFLFMLHTVTVISLLPIGRYLDSMLVSASYDETLVIWDVNNGCQKFALKVRLIMNPVALR